ncbi:MAG: hypothetical protein JKX69_00620 [Rhodobacteraceae bacterium]|nr:hypothetical protein [Paracoccaceae bacterium]
MSGSNEGSDYADLEGAMPGIIEMADVEMVDVEMNERKPLQTIGILANDAAHKVLVLRQFAPARPAQAAWLEHVWTVQWQLPPGKRLAQKTVPFPAFNLVTDRQKGCALFGCPTNSFTYHLEGEGQVVGFRLRPAAQAAFWQIPAWQLTDRAVDARAFLSPPMVALLDL